MALVTVQRSPSPSNSPEAQLGSDAPDGESDQKSPHKSQSFSETYLAVKGAVCILPQSECLRTITRGSYAGDIQTHLQSMYYLMRSQDTIKVAVKLESMYPNHNRYLVVVSTIDRQDTEESVILGVDIMHDQASVGLVLTVWGDMTIRLDGDGGFSLASNNSNHIFKPVSVQAMWSALQSLIRVRNIAQRNNYYPKGLTHTWVTYYEVRIKSDQSCMNEWNVMEDVESHKAFTSEAAGSQEKAQVEKAIKGKLKAIMMTVDLEEVTSVYLRTRLEESMAMSLAEYKPFIDEEMIVIMRQMDAASQVFDYIYLGSEWNASNLEELQEQGIGNILNMAREIDNFFPGVIDYYNVRVYDVEQAELLRHWDNTFKFINRIKQQRQKVLVHCKMGVSRSACTVMAYAMKEYGWTLEQAYQFVKQKRSCIKPNAGFMKQLIIYQGILDASKQRHNKLWRSVSAGNLNDMTCHLDGSDGSSEVDAQNEKLLALSRPRSWIPQDCEMNRRKHRQTDNDELSSNDGGACAVNSPTVECSGGASSTTGEVAVFTLDEDSPSNNEAALQDCANVSSKHPAVNVGEWCDTPHAAMTSVRKVEEWMAKTSRESNVEAPIAATTSKVTVDKLPECPALLHESIQEQCTTEEGCSGSVQMAQSAAALSTAKVRPDSSWIKEELPVPSDGATVDEDNTNSVAEDEPIAVVSIDVPAIDVTSPHPKPCVTVSDDCDSIVNSHGVTERKEIGVVAHYEKEIGVVEHYEKEIGVVEHYEKEIGVVAHYEKELIPWNTGTVRRQTQDLEHRLKSGLKLTDTSSPDSSAESPVSVHNDFISATTPNDPDVGDNSGDDTLLMSPDLQTKTPVSTIYASEDISLEPGIVMRTKCQIEERTKTIGDENENHPVQRSSSCKDGHVQRCHKRRNRNCDRRKTCLPVLQPFFAADILAPASPDTVLASVSRRCSTWEEQNKGSGSQMDETIDVKVYQIGSEQVEMQKDKVKRRTKDFEELSKEEQEEVTPATSALRPSHSLSTATSALRPSHSLSKDDIDLRTGSVLEQKLTMELKFGSVAEGGESAHRVVNTVAEGSESVHVVVNTDNTTDPFKTNAHVVDSHDKNDGDIPMLVYDDDLIFDADLNVDITSELTHCNSCSSQRIGRHRVGCERASIEDGKHEQSGDRDGHDIAANNDKCGDAGCKYCSRVLNAYYRGEGDETQLPMTTATDDSLPRMTGLVGVAYSAGTVDYSEPRHNRPTEPIRKHSTMTHKSKSFSDVNSALFYSSNYDLPGVLRGGGYPTHDYSIVGVKSNVDVPQQEPSRQHSHHPSELHDRLNKSVTSGQSSCDDVGAVPVSVYEQEDITCRVRTTWQQQADKHTMDTPALWQQQADKHTMDTPALWQQQADKHTTDTPTLWQQQADKHTMDTPALWQQQADKHTMDTPALWQQQADKHTTDTPALWQQQADKHTMDTPALWQQQADKHTMDTPALWQQQADKHTMDTPALWQQQADKHTMDTPALWQQQADKHTMDTPALWQQQADKHTMDTPALWQQQADKHTMDTPALWQQQADKHTMDIPALWQQQADKHTMDTPALWQQQADKHTMDTPALTPSSACKMDAQTLSLIRSVASAFQCSPVRRRGIVRRLAKESETRLSLQSPIPVCPGSKPEVSLPFVCSRMQAGASHDSLVSCRDSVTVLTPDKSPVFVDDGDGAVSQSFTSSRVLQLNTELSQADELTATSESTIEMGKKSTFASSPTDDCRVRNLVEIFEPKDGVCAREPSGANVGIQSSIVKRLTWHAGDKSKPKFDVASRNAVPLNAHICVESPPGRRRTLSDTWAVPVTGGSVCDQRWHHTSSLDDSPADGKVLTKLVELSTVPEVTPLPQQQCHSSSVPTQAHWMPPSCVQPCHATGRRPCEFTFPLSAQPHPSEVVHKTRKLQGKSHPLSKLSGETSLLCRSRSTNPFYNTM